MSELKKLSDILEGGVIPTGYDEKAIGKLSKAYLKLENRRVVNLYPIRAIMHEDSRYCLYACPLNGSEISDDILQNIKADVDALEVGEIRYDSVQADGNDYYIVNPDTGRHILQNEEDLDSVMEISDRYDGIILFSRVVLSSKKAYQLDCSCALVGLKEQPNHFKIEPIPNSVIGQTQPTLKFDGLNKSTQTSAIPGLDVPQEAPAAEKYSSAMTWLSIIIIIGLLIWYLFLK